METRLRIASACFFLAALAFFVSGPIDRSGFTIRMLAGTTNLAAGWILVWRARNAAAKGSSPAASNPDLRPFHHAFPVHDLAAARDFYGRVLGCTEGRSSAAWIDFNLFGHQIVAHLDAWARKPAAATSPVDRHDVPVPHFGVVLDWDVFHTFADRLRQNGVRFEIEPQVRFAGKVGEQATMFFFDPSHNALEFKSMRHPEQLFARG
jgi:uncharacterized protein